MHNLLKFLKLDDAEIRNVKSNYEPI